MVTRLTRGAVAGARDSWRERGRRTALPVVGVDRCRVFPGGRPNSSEGIRRPGAAGTRADPGSARISMLGDPPVAVGKVAKRRNPVRQKATDGVPGPRSAAVALRRIGAVVLAQLVVALPSLRGSVVLVVATPHGRHGGVVAAVVRRGENVDVAEQETHS